jgi:hypothetical protein
MVSDAEHSLKLHLDVNTSLVNSITAHPTPYDIRDSIFAYNLKRMLELDRVN